MNVQIDGGKVLLRVERSPERNTHGGVGQRGNRSTVNAAHRIIQSSIDRQEDSGFTRRPRFDIEADEACYGSVGKAISRLVGAHAEKSC